MAGGAFVVGEGAGAIAGHVDGTGPDLLGAAALGAALVARLTPDAARRFGELAQREAGPDEADATALAGLSLLWHSYFADPAAAPPPPPGLRVSAACNEETHRSLTRDMPDGAFAQRLRDLTTPVTVLVGAHSPMPRSAADSLMAHLAHGRMVVVEGGGHLPWFEEPGCVARALAAARAQPA